MGKRLEIITQQRLEKVRRLRERGINPYPNSYHRTHTAQEARSLFESGKADPASRVKVAGRVTALRHMGKATFLDLRDGSGKIQAYFNKTELGPERHELVRDFDLGDFLGVEGVLFKTHTGEITVNVSDFTILAKSLEPLPEKWHGLVDVEKRYRQRYLDLISNQTVRDTFLTRSRTIAAIRRFLDERGFIEVETPVLQQMAGGARARPFVTHHEALDEDFYLRIATELYLKRLIVGGFDKVYEIGRIFRNEGISTRHNPEFTTLESYEAYADYNDVMTMLEQMVSQTAQAVLGTTKVTYADSTLDFTPPWKRITLRDAVLQTCGIDFELCLKGGPEGLRSAMQQKGMQLDATMSPAYLIDKLVSTYVEPTLVQPTFLIDYPVETTPLAKTKSDNKAMVERFEAFAAGMEFANAFTELNDPEEQAARFAIQEEWRKQFGDEEAERYQEDFIRAMEYGMPPTGGLGVGIDRLVMLLTNQQSIREVILFPQLKRT
ncbi:MAG: lysine--tRNA ligase [Dehalococcoidia bacterium]|nr:lysine--tRNA ligase [Dehalococcoidia bacterium]